MIIESSVIAGVVRETEFSIPVYSDIECFHISSPVSLLILYKYPAQSGTYSSSFCTAGLVETSPSIVKTHLGASCWTLFALIFFS
jgi:hypothetical protein